MNEAFRQKRVERARLYCMFNLPFFAQGVMSLPVVFDDSVRTAETDGKIIRWNTVWFDSLKTEEIATVLCHEVSHLLFGHLWRAPAGADPDTWNIACDHAVNLMLADFSKPIVDKGLADPFPWPKGFTPLRDPAFAGVAEEAIYSRLQKPKQNPQPQPQPKGKQGSGSGSGSGSGQGQGQGKPQPGKGPPQPGKGRPDPFGEFEIQAPGKPGAKGNKEQWENVLIRSASIAKGKGKLPAGMERLVKEMLEPSVPWFELVRQWLREQANDDWNWQKANLYYSASKFILPVLESEKIGAAVFAKDTSGSIDNEVLARFVSEEQAFLDDCHPRALVDICCDASIHRVASYTAGDKIAEDAPGGGGTDFRPVFEYAEKLPEAPKCLVYLTDLCGTFPEEAPPYPVLWVTWERGGKAPFGEVIYAGK